MLLQRIAQRELLPAGGRQLEVGSPVAYLQHSREV